MKWRAYRAEIWFHTILLVQGQPGLKGSRTGWPKQYSSTAIVVTGYADFRNRCRETELV